MILRSTTDSTTETLTSPSSGDDSLHDLPLSIIPFDLVQEILCRLPVKSLMQFQCVCKPWKSLISGDYQFARKHLQMSITQSRYHLVVNKTNDLPLSSIFNAVSDTKIKQTKLRYPPILNIGYFDLVGSCHGIVCFEIPYFVVFWNPSNGKYKASPYLKFAEHYGFGYDHVNDSYKLVAVYNYDNQGDSSDNGNGNDDDDDDDDDDEFEVSKKTEVMVHTLGTDCWRKIQKFPCGVPVGVCKSAGTFVGGAINWVTSKDGNEFYASSYSVVSLDMANETYQEILQPDYGEIFVVGLTLGVLRDCLCIFSHGESFVDIWLMKEYGEKNSWNKLFTIPFIKDIGLNLYNKAIYIYEDEQVLLVSSDDDFRLKPKLVVYDSKSDTYKFPDIEFRKVPTIYVESLITTCS